MEPTVERIIRANPVPDEERVLDDPAESAALLDSFTRRRHEMSDTKELERSQPAKAPAPWYRRPITVTVASATVVLAVIVPVALLRGASDGDAGARLGPAASTTANATTNPVDGRETPSTVEPPGTTTPGDEPGNSAAAELEDAVVSAAGTAVLYPIGCVVDLEIDPTGAIWSACGDGLRRLDGGDEWTAIPGPKGTFDIDFAADGVLVALSWDSSEYELSTWTGDVWSADPAVRAWAIDAAPDGSVWAASAQPARRYDRDDRWVEVDGTITPAPSDFGDRVLEWLDVSVAGDGTVWLVLDLGGQVYEWDGQLRYIGEGYEKVWAAPDGSVWARISPEAFGRDWGVDQYVDGTWAEHPELDGIFVKDVAFDQDGHVWVASEGSGLRRFDGTGWISFGADTGMPAELNCVIADGNDVWVGTNAGVIRFTPSS